MAVGWQRILGIFLIFLGFPYFLTPAQESPPLQVVTSWSILEDVVKNVGKDRVQVQSLAPRGVDLHDIQLTPSDQIRLREADWVIWLGLDLEVWLVPSLRKIAEEKQLQIGVHLTDLLPTDSDHSHGPHDDEHDKDHDDEHNEDHDEAHSDQMYNPHIWHSVPMMMQVSELIAAGLSKQDPNHAQFYRQNAENYRQKLQQLDTWIHQQLRFIPESQRILVTSHEAFEYLGKTYGFQTWSPHGLSHHDQPTPKELQEIIVGMKEKKVSVLFTEVGANPAMLNQIAKEIQIAARGSLIPDNLAPLTQEGDTYESFMRFNVRNIAQAFKTYLPQ